jgi:hypothetical protein
VAEFTDDECIAIAMLHGCTFNYSDRHDGVWIIGDHWSGPIHPVEQKKQEEGGAAWFKTREALARTYCEYYKLLEDHNAEA